MEKKETIVIKNSWQDVTVREYMELCKLATVPFTDMIDYGLRLLCILSDKDREYLESVPAVNIPGWVKLTAFVGTTPGGGKLHTSYRINGRKYNAVLNVREFSAIQYIDMTTLLQQNGVNENLHKLLSVILIPEGKEYNTYDLEEVQQEIYEHFRIVDALALSGFFLSLTKILIERIKTYSVSKLKELEKEETNPQRKENIRKVRKELKALQKSGAGSTTWM